MSKSSQSPIIALTTWLLLPANAWACDDSWTVSLIELCLVLAMLALLAWGARTMWLMAAKAPPRSRVFLVVSGIFALYLGWMGIYLVPKTGALLSGFTELPSQTRLILEFNYLLLIPAVLMPFMVYLLKGSPRRERYFIALATGECTAAYFSMWALYSPMVQLC